VVQRKMRESKAEMIEMRTSGGNGAVVLYAPNPPA